MSDTHDIQISDVPLGDVLIHAGDLTTVGTIQQVTAQVEWLKPLLHPHKVVIAGNHDRCLDPTFKQNPHAEDYGVVPLSNPSTDINWGSIHYLNDSSVTLHLANGRDLTIYGNPHTPKCGTNWAFFYDPKTTPDYWSHGIPSDAEIVITHAPPAYHVDTTSYGGNYGCKSLLGELERSKPKLAVCGHVHEARGEDVVVRDEMRRVRERAVTNEGTGRDVVTALGWKVRGVKWAKDGGAERERVTRLVNAAVPGEDGYREPIVVMV